MKIAWRTNDAPTQPAIIKATGLSQQTVSRLVSGLVEKGILKAGESRMAGRRGPPSMSVQLVSDFCYTFGVAMMTDALSVTLMDFSGEILEYELHPMLLMSRNDVIGLLSKTIKKFIKKRKIDPKKVLGVGVGISGYSLGGHARFRTPGALSDWGLVNLDDILEEALGFMVVSENDGNTSAIGECYMGVGRSYDDFCYLFIAAGIGGGIIQNHELIRGAHRNAGEIGLMVPQKLYGHPNLELLRQLLIKDGIEISTISELIEKYDPNWKAIEKWIALSKEPMSLIASSLAAALDPEAIVIGGRIPKDLTKRLIPQIELYDYSQNEHPRPLPRIIPSDVEGEACASGAALLPLMRYLFPV